MRVLIDTGFIYGYCHAKDARHGRAVDIFDQIKYSKLYLAWPVTYEALRTKFVNRKPSVELFEKFLRDTQIEFIDDSIYREEALAQTIKGVMRGRPISMVDMLLRFMLDRLHRIDAIVTFNVADFQDVCRRKNIRIIN